MKWDKNNKNKMFSILQKKAEDMSYNEWASRVDNVGIKRIIRDQKKKMYLEGFESNRANEVKRDSDCIQISNPWWHGYQNNCSKHVVFIPKELAEKILILGDMP